MNVFIECWDNCRNEIKSDKYLFDGIKFENIIGPWYEYYEIDEWTDWVKNSGKSVIEIKDEIEKDLEKMLIEWQSEYLNDKLKNIKR